MTVTAHGWHPYPKPLPDDTPDKVEVGAIGGEDNATFGEEDGFRSGQRPANCRRKFRDSDSKSPRRRTGPRSELSFTRVTVPKLALIGAATVRAALSSNV